MDEDSQLFKKVYGSMMGSAIGSAMGAAVEWVSVPGGGWRAIESHFGWVETLLAWVQKDRDVRYWNSSPPLHYYHMDMPAGMTEDGAEIRYLLALTMIEKGGRITVEDMAEVWKREIKREDIGRLVNPHIKIIYDRLTAGDQVTRLSPRVIGSLMPWPGVVDACHMIGPVGIINAGNPWQAAQDAREVSLLMQPPVGGGGESSMVVAAAVAEAFRPGATVESVVEASKAHVSTSTREIVDEALAIAREYPDIRAIREPINRHFAPTYPYGDAVEVAAESIALFWITRGDPRQSLIAATNLGRDTDCIGGCLGAIVGAFAGIDAIPTEWADTVQKAISANRYTVQRKSLKEISIGLMGALLGSLDAEAARIRQIQSLSRA